jgi:hypothetical protein
MHTYVHTHTQSYVKQGIKLNFTNKHPVRIFNIEFYESPFIHSTYLFTYGLHMNTVHSASYVTSAEL